MKVSDKTDFCLIESRLHADWQGEVWLRNSNPDQSYGISNNGEKCGGKASKIHNSGRKYRTKLIFA
jgi:hypothetical protein